MPSSPSGRRASTRGRLFSARLALLAVVAVLAALGPGFVLPALAQDPRSPAPAGAKPTDQGYRAEVTVRVAQIQVLVTTRDGKPVTDLKPDEIEVSEDGDERRIAFLEPFGGRERSLRVLPRAVPLILDPGVVIEESDTPDGAIPAPAPRRQVALVFDGFNGRPQDRPRWIEAARSWISGSMQPADRVSIAVLERTSVRTVQSFTGDRDSLLQVLASTSFFPPAEQVDMGAQVTQLLANVETCKSSPSGLSCALNAASPTVFEWQGRYGQTLASLRSYVATLAAMPGRKVVLYLGSGILVDAGALAGDAIIATFGTDKVSLSTVRSRFQASLQGLMLDMTRVAAAGDVTFFTFDTRSVAKREGATDVERQDTLHERRIADPYATAFDTMRATMDVIATRTGGRGLHGPKIEVNLPAAADSISGLYTLGYYREPGAQGLPKVKARVTRRGVQVSFPDRYDPLRGLPLALGLEIGIGHPRPVPDGVLLPLVVQMPLPELSFSKARDEGKDWTATLALFAEAVTPKGERVADTYEVVDSSIPDRVYQDRSGKKFSHTLRLTLKPGAYRIRVRVADAEFKRASERALDITVMSDLSVVPGIQDSVRDQNPVRREAVADPAGMAETTAK